VSGTIVSIDVVECRVPLRRVLDLGNLAIADRDYTIVRIRDDEGREGVAWGYSRGADIASVVRHSFSPHLIGTSLSWGPETWTRLYGLNPYINQGGLYLRALSLVDIALWDLESSPNGSAIRQFVGREHTSRPITIACCYPVKGKTIDDDAAEARRIVDLGFRSIKVCGADGGPTDTSRLKAIRKAVGNEVELKIDLHWLWTTSEAARFVVREWEDLNVAWIEDAFPAEAVDELKRLKDLTNIPLAYGDEQNGRYYMGQLISSGCVDVLRVDATVVGGITEFLRVGREANAAGIAVSAHVFEEYHATALDSLENATNVERFEPNSGLDEIDRLRRLTENEVVWDWDAVAHYELHRH
jgi:D-arabinonate dehydratase